MVTPPEQRIVADKTPRKNLLHQAERVLQCPHEGNVERELEKREDSDRDEGDGIDDGRGPPLFHVNDEDHGGGESEHCRRHGEKEEGEGEGELPGERVAEIMELKRRRDDGDEHHDGGEGANKRDDVHDGEDKEERVVEEDGEARLVVGATRYGVGGGEGDGGYQNCYNRARLRRAFQPVLRLLEKLRVGSLEELLGGFVVLVVVHVVVGWY
ncbi:hypothetical protein TIFTF001_006001 [Ficus carica]|uniref:Uncharacterized protein n=1 Tax=Ficus carica TaxID=3494 RepID=A0AA88D039_FICCA|nr:hypothetical protein TIFTF001_006001 [Ficus carica]